MAPHDLRRPFKRPAISDQQKRREISLQRQAQSRLDAQHARRLASSILSFQNPTSEPVPSEPEIAHDEEEELYVDDENDRQEFDIRDSSKLKGAGARKWFAKQLMLPEWMIDVPDCLSQDWYVFARPAGKRCFVVATNGTTVSRLKNGCILHRFPSALPNGAKTRGAAGASESCSILDCIFHESDQTYYVIDMICWRGYSLNDCTAEFRLFWLNSKLAESGACDPPSAYHKFRFSLVPVYNCDEIGFHSAYTGVIPYVKDGLLFYNKHAHYQTGNTPLALVWKDENCSQYVIDTDSKGQVLSEQQVVLELQDSGNLSTSDDPPIILGCLGHEFIEKSGLNVGSLLRFAVSNGGLSFVDGKLDKAELHYQGSVKGARAFGDTYSKVVFQYMARHSPVRMDDMLASITARTLNKAWDAEMVG